MADNFKPEYCEQLIAFFTMPTRVDSVVIKKRYDKEGRLTVEEMQVEAKPPPHFTGFARSVGVDEETLYAWAAKHRDFAEAMEKAKAMLKEIIIDGGLCGHYDSRFAQNAMMNLFDWKADGSGVKKDLHNPVQEAWNEGEKRRKKEMEKEKAKKDKDGEKKDSPA